MEIKASARMDYEGIRALIHLTMYKKKDPKKGMLVFSLVLAVVVVMNIAAMIRFYDPILFLPLYMLLLLAFLKCYMYFILPKKRYKNAAKMQGALNEYVFCDSVLKISTKSADYCGTAEVEYSVFTKVYETSKFIFLFQPNNLVYVVDLSTVSGGTVEDIRKTLSAILKDKFYICNY